MDRDEKITRLILKLLKETLDGNLIWSVTEDIKFISLVDEEILDFIYIAKYKEQNFRLFRYKYEYYYEDYDIYSSCNAYRLEMIDDKGKSLYVLPKDSSTENLYDSVREKTSGVNKLIDDLLAD